MTQTGALFEEQRQLLSRPLIVLLVFVPLLLGVILGASLKGDNSNLILGAVVVNPDSPSGIFDEVQSKGASLKFFSSRDFCKQKVEQGNLDACLVMDKKDNNPSLDIIVDYAQGVEVTETVFALSSTIGKSNEVYQLEYSKILEEKIKNIQGSIRTTLPVLGELAGKYQKLSEMLDDLKIRLQSINVYSDINPPPVGDLKNQKKEFESSLHSLDILKDKMSQASRETRNSIEDIMREASISEADKLAVEKELFQGEERIKEISSDFRVTRSLSMEDISQLQAAVDTMIEELEFLDKELNSFSKLQIDVGLQVKEAKSLLDDSLSDLLNLQKLFNAINTNIPSVVVSGIDSSVSTKVSPVIAKEKSEWGRWVAVFLGFLILLSSLFITNILVDSMSKSPLALRRKFAPISSQIQVLSVVAFASLLTLLMTLSASLGIASFGVLSIPFSNILFGALFGGISFSLVTYLSKKTKYSYGALSAFCAVLVLSSEVAMGGFARDSALSFFNPFQLLLSHLRTGSLLSMIILAGFSVLLFTVSVFIWRDYEKA